LQDVLAAIAEMRKQHKEGESLCNPLYGLLCDETEYMSCSTEIAREVTRAVVDFLTEIKYSGVEVEAQEVFSALFRNCDVEKLVVIGQEFGADKELWEGTIETVLSECITGDFSFDTGTYEKLVELCTAIGIPPLDWRDPRVCRAIMSQVRYDDHCNGISTGVERFVEWCVFFDTSIIDFVKTAESVCTDIMTEDGVEPAAATYVNDLVKRGVNREQMLTELDAHGIRDNKLVGLKALECYAYYVKQAYAEILDDADQFIQFVCVMSLFEPGFLGGETVRNAALAQLEDGYANEHIDEKLDTYGLSLHGLTMEELPQGDCTVQKQRAYVPDEIPTLDQGDVDTVFGEYPNNYPVEGFAD